MDESRTLLLEALLPTTLEAQHRTVPRSLCCDKNERGGRGQLLGVSDFLSTCVPLAGLS